VRGALTLAMALAVTAVAAEAAAAAAPATSVHRVLRASGMVKVSFAADGSTCARFGTCGERGTVAYGFKGTPRGRLVLEQGRSGHITGAADFRSHGATVATVIGCSDTVRHRREHFSMRSPSRLGKLIFGLHGAETDYLATDCAGPTEADLKRDGALPHGRFKRSDFRAGSTTFGLKGSSSFRESGYTGTATWKLSYRVKRTR
jgi:hypothetical protein